MSEKVKIISIPVVIRLQDNQDGGYTMYIYNNYEEMIAGHPRADEMTDELQEEIINGEDEYENGYIGEDRIEIECSMGLEYRLAKPLSFGAGQ
jgi:carbamoylphosphate synthase large subunit